MLRDASRAHDLHHVILRYFNVAGADPRGRTGKSSEGAKHLIKAAIETALGLRPKLEVFGADYPTPDGGFSVLEVMEAVKRVSGADFKVEIAPRRPRSKSR
jgi:UDP-glucose 4-epimerase